MPVAKRAGEVSVREAEGATETSGTIAARFELSGAFRKFAIATGVALAAQLFFLKQNATTACDCLLHDLRKLVKQPGQCHLQLNMIVGDINASCSHLAKGADAKRHPVSRPRLLLHHEHGEDWRRPCPTPV